MRKLGIFGMFVIGACGGSDGGGYTPTDAGQDVMPQPDRPPPDAPTNEAGNYCYTPTGPGTIHDKDITASETWGAMDSPHIVKGELAIGGTDLVTLSIDGCAVVKFEAGAGLKVAAGGKRGALKIQPTSYLHPALLTGTTESNGFWKGIYIGPGTGMVDDSKASVIKHATIDYAGGDAGREAKAALYIEGSAKQFSPAVELDGVKIRHSAGYGVYSLKDGRIAAPSSGGSVDINMNDGAPVRVEAGHVAELPSGSYNNNKVERIEVVGIETPCVCSSDGTVCPVGLCVRNSGNWAARGVPYHVKGMVHIGAPVSGLSKAITITLPDGGQFLMAPDSGFAVGVDTFQKGALRVQGSKVGPVVFKPDTGDAAGHWRGIMYGLYSDWDGEGSRIYHTEIRGAGKAFPRDVPKTCGTGSIDGTKGAIVFNMVDPTTKFPPSPEPTKFGDITNTTFDTCAGHAIVRGWDSTATAPDYTVADKMNTFKAVAGCKQTNPQMSGTCSACM